MTRKLIISLICAAVFLGMAYWFYKSWPELLVSAFFVAAGLTGFLVGLNNWQLIGKGKEKLK